MGCEWAVPEGVRAGGTGLQRSDGGSGRPGGRGGSV